MNKIKVLDYGFIKLIDHMGSDKRIVDAARVSTGTASKTIKEDVKLINYLMEHQHTSPFEQVEFTFHIKAPIFVARQWFRHRTGSFNEISGRYSILKTEFYIPEKDRIKGKGKLNKQGSEGEVDDICKDTWLTSLKINKIKIEDQYGMANEFGISNELARIGLPLSTYTQFYWKVNLHNLFHFLKLRMDAAAQYEIREYANVIYSLIKEIVPISSQAFENYVLEARTFSKEECVLIRKYLFGLQDPNIQKIKEKLSI